MTYWIGFRAPTRQGNGHPVSVVYLQGQIVLRRYVRRPRSGADCRAGPHRRADMVEQVSAMLQAIHADRGTVTDFLGII